MSRKLRTEIYCESVTMLMQWRDQREYQLGKDFLKSLVGGPASESSLQPGDIPFYYMDNRSQLDALHEFRRNLKKPRKLD
jgi:hypothetical protein